MTVLEIVADYKAGKKTLRDALTETMSEPFVARESNLDSLWEFDGGVPLDDSYGLLALAFTRHQLSNDDYNRFALALRGDKKALDGLPQATANIFAYSPTQPRDEAGRFGSGGSSGGDAEWEAKYGQADRPTGDGDCFVAAVNVMLDAPADKKDDYTLCHGVPLGQGDIAGVRFDHAWVERQDPGVPFKTVVDKSNGNDVELPAPAYYAIGNINSADVKRYSYAEMIQKILETETYGPWD